MDLAAQIREIAEQNLPDESTFIVKIEAKGMRRLKVLIILDGDNGVTIEQVTSVSRAVGRELDERELIKDEYTFEVTSAGVGEPLELHRQYVKNIDRKVKVTRKNDTKFTGKLKVVNEESIIIDAEIKEKGKKKVEIKEMEIPFSDIEQTVIEVSFN
ncbi:MULTISPECIES: ribosome maturation factor RimP [Flammeovirga]|uniref:Ribosome maturation factor RimP n=1 Tax=Flammeovirga agarivorans TaxID=2726742 RepID=A0A7X8SHJ5_9BACT|nr:MULTISPECIES: ribosome maturation factor RimP [Flammeovirga]NLR90340.1 ribosome maturation factor RimP [Flammeovirga agarivorans]